MEYFIVSILGLIIGSFLNIFIYLISKEQSIASLMSYYHICRNRLKKLYLIPAMIYFITKEKFERCRTKRYCHYPIIEILNALVYILIYTNMGVNILNLKYYIFSSILIVIGVIDYKTKYIYSNTIIFSEIIALVFVIIEFIFKGQGAVEFIIGGFLGLVILKLIQILTNGIGDGDIEIGIVCGSFLGISGVISTIFLAIMLGGIAGMLMMVLRLRKGKDTIPFVPFIAVAAFITILYGNKILDAYMNLI